MNSLVNTVRRKVSASCRVKRCRKEGCTVRLSTNLRPFVLIDMDRCPSLAPKQGKHCDFLFFGQGSGEDWVVPMELKKGKANASEIVSQLKAGAIIAESLVPNSISVKFQPVAAYGGGLRRHELRDFKKKRNQVRF